MSIQEDSRKVKPGDVFFATRGQGFDGCAYVQHAFSMGARYAVVPLDYVSRDSDRDRLVHTLNPNELYAYAAREMFGRPDQSLKVIGVTGTNGKTSTTWLTARILNFVSIGTLGVRFNGTEIGLPDNMKLQNTTPDAKTFYKVLRTLCDRGYKGVVCEVSSHAIALSRVAGCEFQSAGFTNLSQDHLDFHGSMQAYFDTKLQFLSKVGQRLWINGNCPWGQRLIQELSHASVYGESGDLKMIRCNYDIPFSTLDFELRSRRIQVKAHTSMAAFPENIGLALGLASEWCELPTFLDISDCVVPGRCELYQAVEGQTVVIDYAHTPDALQTVLTRLRQLFPSKHVHVVFGCGGDREPHKRKLMGEVASQYADTIVLTNDNPRSEDPEKIVQAIVQGVSQQKLKSTQIILDRARAIQSVLQATSGNDIVIIAGKGHEDYQIIGKQRVPFKDQDICQPYLVNTSSSNFLNT